jgi:hypothetical protein
MNDLPEYRSPKSQQALVLLSALLGLVLVNFAMHSFVSEKSPAVGWGLLLLGLASLTTALWLAVRNRKH